MKYNGHALRHELKYVINYPDSLTMASTLSAVMRRDENSGEDGYFIRSLYFDDIYNDCYIGKEDGVSRRRKYRIRTYNMNDGQIKFEIKDKYGSFISKSSDEITVEQCEMMMRGDYDFMLDSASPSMRMAFIDARTKMLRPVVLVDYTREVFVADEGNVRITFDKELRAGIGSCDIFSSSVPTIPAMDADKLILEIKYDDFIPGFVKGIVSGARHWQTAESKFWMCRKAQNIYYRKDIPYESVLLNY